MKLSKQTTDILKNFSSINPSILLRPGSVLRTITSQKNVVAEAKIAETIPSQAAIYDLSQFLGTLSLFSDPEIEFGDKAFLITDSTGARASYSYASTDAIVSAPDKSISLRSEDVVFTLEEKSLASALKAAAVMGLPNVSLIGRAGRVYLAAVNSADPSAHNWEQPVGKSDTNFNILFRLEVLKLLPSDYEVTISKNEKVIITRFQSEVATYFIAAETGSKFN